VRERDPQGRCVRVAFATAVVEQWGQATSLLSPRYARLSIQFDF